MQNTPRRLPGIRIEASAPRAEQALPRMDVAVLVGFASTGPLHLPVAIESVNQYAAVFGADAPLAWDAARGERVSAYLGPAVRGFFANGGRRCWVIRTARSAALEAAWRGISVAAAAELPGVARANRHAVPGVLAVSTTGLAAAVAASHCEGAWSDGLRLSSALQQRSVAIDALTLGSPPGSLQLRSTLALKAGDLLQLGDTRSLCAYAVVESVLASPVGLGQAVQARVIAAFERLAPASAPLAVTGTVAWAEVTDAVAGALSLPVDGDAPARLQLDTPLPARGAASSDWARWSAGADQVWLRIDDIERSPWPLGSPPLDDAGATQATLTGPAWRALGAVLPLPLQAETVARVLTLELLSEDGAEGSRLRDLGLTPGQAQSWWQKRSDAERYRARDGSVGDGPVAPLAAPGFPLASAEAEGDAGTVAWLPLGVAPLFGAPLAPLPQSGTALERDGLSRCDAELFLDPELADTTVANLVAQADTIRLLRDEPRALFGLHAALGIGSGGLYNEASLIALPDAVHLGWLPRSVPVPPAVLPKDAAPPLHWQTHRGGCAKPAQPDKQPLQTPDFGNFLDCATRRLPTPVLSGPALPVLPGSLRLDWVNDEPDLVHVLHEAVQPDMSEAREIYRGTASGFDASVPLEGSYFYRVHAESGDERSAGSNVVAVQVRSNEWVQLDPETTTQAERDAMEARWLAVHRAALRLGAATGELFAVLALPRHFRTPEVLRHAQRLRSVRAPASTGSGDADALGAGEAVALSYGALFHPWLQADRGAPQRDAQSGNVVALQRRTPRVVPPDGVSLGVVAARAASRGAWVAPANEPLKDVVALAPAVPAADLAALQEAQVNVLRADPRGLYALSADTLSQEVDLRPISTRRLLTLLRRLAQRRGNRYVFEPLGPVLRRAVQRGFNELLTDLFRRGAFAGATAEQSFRVVTDDTVNTPRDADAGRFIIELRVAPAVPMRFITVRLTQSGERLSVVEQT